MTRLYVFADEAGCFEFSRKQNASIYFILCTISMDSCEIGNALLELRRRLAWDGVQLGEYFHATTDQQAVRDAVFAEIAQHRFEVHATIMEKPKAEPQVRVSRPRFYKYGWFYHFKYVAPKIIKPTTELLTTAASLGQRKERQTFLSAINDVMTQTVRKNKWATNFCPAAADPCVQVADYCAWALQRKWERKDQRSYDLIKDRITHEADMWAHGKVLYY